jgi:hypothetical protein
LADIMHVTQGRTLVPLTGLMVLGLLFLLMFIAMGMSYFGGTFFDPIPGASLATGWVYPGYIPNPAAVYRGAAVLVSLAPGTDPGDPAVWKPALTLQVDTTRARVNKTPRCKPWLTKM